MARPKQTEEKFWSHVNVRDLNQCWPWLRSTTNVGYGQVAWHGIHTHAHRLAAWLVGLTPTLRAGKYLHLLHTCDNRLCCNPTHLYIGTPQQNAVDRRIRGRQLCRIGGRNTQAKLNARQIHRLRKQWASGRWKQWQLAKHYGITRSHVSSIVCRRVWIHLT
jgi:hypothetical protein